MIPGWLCVFLGGGVGALLRFGVVKLTPQGSVQLGFPWSILLINLTGSLALGFCIGLATQHSKDHAWWMFTTTGVLGGFTTFSTLSGDTLLMLQQQRLAHAFLNAFGSPALGLICAFIGWAIAIRIKS